MTLRNTESWHGDRVSLHFDAVDYEARVWVNDKALGGHRGGYDTKAANILWILACRTKLSHPVKDSARPGDF